MSVDTIVRSNRENLENGEDNKKDKSIKVCLSSIKSKVLSQDPIENIGKEAKVKRKCWDVSCNLGRSSNIICLDLYCWWLESFDSFLFCEKADIQREWHDHQISRNHEDKTQHQSDEGDQDQVGLLLISLFK